MEEERRLFYVGMTRAMEELYLFSASSRMQFGNWTDNRPSRFLAEIPEAFKEVSGLSREVMNATDIFKDISADVSGQGSIDRISNDSKYRVGATVFHPSFGEGKIKQVEGRGLDMKVTVHFIGFGQKKFLAHYAPFRFN